MTVLRKIAFLLNVPAPYSLIRTTSESRSIPMQHIRINRQTPSIWPLRWNHASSSSTSAVSVENHGNSVVHGMKPVDRSCTEIIIVRHGETEWNALGKIQGQMDIDLNEIGRQQAQAVAEHLAREPLISAVYSSDLKRALETAQIIAAECCGLKVIKDRDLRERHMGDFQGLVFHDLQKFHRKAYDALRSRASDQEIPGGGESRRELQKRCTSTLQRIGKKHRGQRVVVVTHGAVIETLYKHALPDGKLEGTANASIGIIQLSEGDVWSVKSWNGVSHLREMPYLKEFTFGEDSSS